MYNKYIVDCKKKSILNVICYRIFNRCTSNQTKIINNLNEIKRTSTFDC